MLTSYVRACIYRHDAEYLELLRAYGRWSRGRYPGIGKISCRTPAEHPAEEGIDDASALIVDREMMQLKIRHPDQFTLLKRYYIKNQSIAKCTKCMGMRPTLENLRATQSLLTVAEKELLKRLQNLREYEKISV